jgi:hypothetical protein
MLTNVQLQTLAAHIRANTDPAVVSALAVRNDVAIAAWYNQKSTTDAWRIAVSRNDLFEQMPIATYDGLSAGKRQAWQVMLDCAPVDFSLANMRKGVLDMWAATDANAILATACVEKTLNGEVVFGGESKTSGTVTAIKRNYIGIISLNDVSNALNAY